MNRRSFFTKLGLAAATLAVLPSATTYARKWVAPTAANPLWIPNPAWETAAYHIHDVWHPGAGTIFNAGEPTPTGKFISTVKPSETRFAFDPSTGGLKQVDKMILA